MRKTITPQPKHKNLDIFHVCLQAKNNVGMMLMKFNFHQKILTEMNDETEKSSIRIRKKKEPPLYRTYTLPSRDNFKFREVTPEADFRRRLTLNSENKISIKGITTHTGINFLEKNLIESTHYNELSNTHRLIKSEKHLDRLKDSKTRREDL
jgi:hypothetical protein